MADENTTQPVEISEIEAKDIATWIIDAGAEWESQLLNQLSEAYGTVKGSAIFDVVKKIKVGALTSGLAWDSSKTIDQNVVNIAGGTLPSLVGSGMATGIGYILVTGGVVASAPAWLIGTIAVSSGIALDAGLKQMGINVGDIVESTYTYMVDHISASSADSIDFHLETTSENYLNNESSLVQTLKNMDNPKSVTLNFEDNVTLTYNPITDTVEMHTTNVEKLVIVNEYLQNSVFAYSNIKSDILDYTVINNDLQNKSIDYVRNLEQNIYDNLTQGLLSDDIYQTISKNISDYIVGYSGTTSLTDLYFNDMNPTDIGAFYESTTQIEDTSTSIADKTFVLLDKENKGVTKEQLENLDTNGNGKLDENEISSLRTWKDTNEDGIAQEGEISILDTTVLAKNYDTFTRGNSEFLVSSEIVTPNKLDSSYTQPTSNYSSINSDIPVSNYSSMNNTMTVPSVPNSNFSSLRANDNVYVSGDTIITWDSNQVKINYKNKSYQIGTNGDDSFDYRYYSQYSQYFNVNLLRNFLGGGGNDTVGGSDYADNIWGGTGNDTLYGYNGDDKIYGESGDDVLLGQNGNDKLFGGEGNDTLAGHIGNDSLYGGIGDDEFYGGEGNDIIVGEAGEDLAFGEVGNDTIYGGEGNDILVGFTASNDTKQTLESGETDDDLIFGGAGNDTVVGGLGTDKLYGESGMDTIYGGEGNDYIDGGSEDDTLFGENGDDTIFGGLGNDEIQGENGNDILSGEDGDDRVWGQTGNDTIYGGAGDDLLVGFTASNEDKQTLENTETDDDLIYGGIGDDTILGQIGNDKLYGESGKDVIKGGEGNDYIDGGSEDDTLFGENGDDTIFGGLGNDEIQGEDGNDILSGEDGDDRVWGQTGDDTIYGGAGDDLLVGFTASNEDKQTLENTETDNDFIYGGDGNDIILGQFGEDHLFGELGEDAINGGLGNDYIDGGADNDALSGGDGNDTIFGGSGTDELQGGNGNDSLFGEDGADKIFGQTGDDVIFGGSGDDILLGFTADNESKQSLEEGETDNDTIYGEEGNDLIIGRYGEDKLFGGTGNDELQGGDAADMLYGEDGDDRIFGQEGDDIIYGGAGDDIIVGSRAYNESQIYTAEQSDNDFLYGGEGNDTIIGGYGNDYIDGGAGADQMEGGEGNDFYIVNSINDSILELDDSGYDTVVSNTNYQLNKNVEELRLVEGYDINATGNALDNVLIGNSSDNILDGVTGKDTMIGGQGNDIYYVDNEQDQIVEAVNEGNDTVYSTIDYTLEENVENIQLLDFSKAEHGLVDGENTLVYGYPKMYELDYMQGDAVEGFQGTCALTAIANLLTQNDVPTSETEVVNVAIDNNWAVTDINLPEYIRGGSNYIDQQSILDSYGMSNDVLFGYNPDAIANLIQSGRGVILALNAGNLWDEEAYVDNGGVNHVVTVTGAVYKESDNSLAGFYIADSGRGKVTDMTRYISLEKFEEVANVSNAYAIYTNEPIKLWDENVNAYGNDTDNIIVGNRGENELYGYQGNDSLEGGKGNDSLYGGIGDDIYSFSIGDGNDTISDDSGNDKIVFNTGIEIDDIVFSYKDSDLIISYTDENDSIKISDQNTSLTAIESIELSTGEFLTSSDMDNIIQQMNAYIEDNGLEITSNQDIKNNQELMSLVQNSWNNAA